MEISFTNGSGSSTMDQVKFVEDNLQKNLKGYGLLKQAISLQIFLRLSSTNFTRSILEYFVPNDHVDS